MCANIRFPLFVFSVKFVLGFQQKISGNFPENYAENLVHHFTKSGIFNICAHRNAIFIRSLESSRQARSKTPHLFAESTTP